MDFGNDAAERAFCGSILACDCGRDDEMSEMRLGECFGRVLLREALLLLSAEITY
jgi:hypothetical protein